MALSMHAFTKLFLAKMADNSYTAYFDDNGDVAAEIPFNYRERIQNILCADNGWKDTFSDLIDCEIYFKDHFFWEIEFAEEMLKVADELGRTFTFDIVHEYMSIGFFMREIHEIYNRYDKKILSEMSHFVHLMMDPIYSRKFKEEFVDYSAKSVKKMRKINAKDSRKH